MAASSEVNVSAQMDDSTTRSMNSRGKAAGELGKIPYSFLEHGLKTRGSSSKLHEWSFHDDLWLRFVLKKKTRGGPL